MLTVGAVDTTALSDTLHLQVGLTMVARLISTTVDLQLMPEIAWFAILLLKVTQGGATLLDRSAEYLSDRINQSG
jgi:hypothetical protein